MYLHLYVAILFAVMHHSTAQDIDEAIRIHRKDKLICTVSVMETDPELTKRATEYANHLAKKLGNPTVVLEANERIVLVVDKLSSLKVIDVLEAEDNKPSEKKKLLTTMEYDRVGFSKVNGRNGTALVMIFRENERAFQDHFTMVLKSHRASRNANDIMEGSADLDKMAGERAKTLKDQQEPNLEKSNDVYILQYSRKAAEGKHYDVMQEALDLIINSNIENGRTPHWTEHNNMLLDEKVHQVGFGYSLQGEWISVVAILKCGPPAGELTLKSIVNTLVTTMKSLPSSLSSFIQGKLQGTDNIPKTEGVDNVADGSVWPKYQRFTYFFGMQSPFSQMHPVNFKGYFLDGVVNSKDEENANKYQALLTSEQTFTTCEHWMMAHKAIAFGAFDKVDTILKETDAKKVKGIGSGVPKFDDTIWDLLKWKIVMVANIYKYTTNEDLWNELLLTEGTTLVETNPTDKIWGIGLRQTNPYALDPENWVGINLLGEILTELRDRLQYEFKGQPWDGENNVRVRDKLLEEIKNGNWKPESCLFNK